MRGCRRRCPGEEKPTSRGEESSTEKKRHSIYTPVASRAYDLIDEATTGDLSTMQRGHGEGEATLQIDDALLWMWVHSRGKPMRGDANAPPCTVQMRHAGLGTTQQEEQNVRQ